MATHKQRLHIHYWAVFTVFLACALLLTAAYSRASEILAEPIPTGTLILKDSSYGHECKLALNTKDYAYSYESSIACPFVSPIKSPDHIKLMHAPSALTITFFKTKSGSGCDTKDFRYKITMKTRKNDVSTNFYNIDHMLRGAEARRVLTPGVEFIEVFREKDIDSAHQYYKTLSCISVKRSD
jgi:hypothetical protein